MARPRKAVDTGNTEKGPTTRRHDARSINAAEQSNAGKPSCAMSSSTPTKPKRNPRRAAKDQWDEEKLMTTSNSQLIGVDLVKLLANPQAWNCLEESEKQEILDLLPDGTHPNPNPPPDNPDAKIPPLPEDFLRYSNNWRDGIRQFQLDLQNGRYDPLWQRDAHRAMEERAAGKFDKFKEEEFEQFWGQKQKMDKTLTAGQSSQVKLKTLVDNGVIREGDVWRYSRVFSRPRRIFVEKEVRIMKANGARLSFLVPPGQRVFLKSPKLQKPEDAEESKMNAVAVDGQEEIISTEIDSGTHSNTSGVTEAGSSNKRKSELEEHGDYKRQCSEPPGKNDQMDTSTQKNEDPTNVIVEIVNPPIIEKVPSAESVKNSVQTIDKPDNGDEVSNKPSEPAPQPDQEPRQTSMAADTTQDIDEILVEDIQGPSALSAEIIKIDGRIQSIPSGSGWKEFRTYRDNQDMGTLWEVRRAWFLKTKSLRQPGHR
ncbi:hypothetical protein BO71DRAFT_450186 [Aspergillus ellipticus CBS 707.79]|uniref:DEUBAD domain-containing protein n=1 Tax=Aspergillus ellipticus CBS 707.79 TaxID=1448320 RepID=A0A319DA01_9EURO|nr:hypothetical protein BO71DRAFT_450186 [Aspergillus ellipticus CBS 707.79]